MFKLGILVLLMASSSIYANEDALSVDRVITGNVELNFPNVHNVQPEQSDFAINNFVLMSNDSGERWAVVTVSNQASGRRSLTHKHLMAMVADGQRISPSEFSQSFKGNETLSITINFGRSKFPLLSVFSNPD